MKGSGCLLSRKGKVVSEYGYPVDDLIAGLEQKIVQWR